MEVPEGVRLDPASTHLLKQLPDVKQAREVCMEQADDCRSIIAILEKLAYTLRSYAASLSCADALMLVELLDSLQLQADVMVKASAIVPLLHPIHHDHSKDDPVKRADQLISCLPVTLEVYLKASKQLEDSLERRAEAALINTFATALFGSP